MAAFEVIGNRDHLMVSRQSASLDMIRIELASQDIMGTVQFEIEH
jgi:hypothetical protein